MNIQKKLCLFVICVRLNIDLSSCSCCLGVDESFIQIIVEGNFYCISLLFVDHEIVSATTNDEDTSNSSDDNPDSGTTSTVHLFSHTFHIVVVVDSGLPSVPLPTAVICCHLGSNLVSLSGYWGCCVASFKGGVCLCNS
jgi:hypothetical protein